MDPHGIAEQVMSGDLKVWRQSTQGSAEICLRRARYGMEPGRPYKAGEARAAGTGYHAGVEVFFDGCLARDGLIVPPDDATFLKMILRASEVFLEEVARHEKDNGPGTFPWETSPEATQARITKMLEAWRAQEAWPDPTLYRVTGVEQEWWAPFMDGWAAKGTVDLVLENLATGATEFEDHKTAGKKWPKTKGSPRQSPQPGTYAWAWWRLTGELPAKFHYGVMTYSGVFERRTFDITAETVQRTIDKALQYIPLVELPLEALPGNTSSNLCSERYCDEWNICPYGAAFR